MKEKKVLTQEDYNRNRKRYIRHELKVSEVEEEIIQKGMKDTGLTFTEFILEMVVHKGVIINQDFESLRIASNEINKIGVNINQIAHKVNTENFVQNEDLAYIKKEMKKIWAALNKAIKQDSFINGVHGEQEDEK